jgi:hypothetical protein
MGVVTGLILGGLLVASCGAEGPLPKEDLAFRLSADADTVDFGRPFAVTVVRAWRDDLVPAPWDDAVVRPLALRPLGTTTRTAGGKVEETRRFDAFVFSLADVSVAAPVLVATDSSGRESRSAPGEALTIRVRRALDPAAPGAPEFPGGPIPEPVRWGWWGALAAVVLGAGGTALVLRRRRARRPVVVPVEPSAPAVAAPPTAAHRALARLETLRGERPGSREENDRWHVEVSSVLREYAAERWDLRTAEATTEEILASLGGRCAGGAISGARDVLRAADLVKFARDESGAAARERTIDVAFRFVRETAAR